MQRQFIPQSGIVNTSPPAIMKNKNRKQSKLESLVLYIEVVTETIRQNKWKRVERFSSALKEEGHADYINHFIPTTPIFKNWHSVMHCSARAA